MSDLTAVLNDVLRGGNTDARAVLHNCRLDGAGVTSYGREAILQAFRSVALSPKDVQIVYSTRFAALFASADHYAIALFADLYGRNIARLWYLAATPLPLRHPSRIDVPSDPTLDQRTPSLAFDHTEHPDLASAHVSRVIALVAAMITPETAPDRLILRSEDRLTQLRSYVLRAFSDGDTVAVLLMVSALLRNGGPGRIQFPVAARFHSDNLADMRLVVDEAQCDAELARKWRPIW